MAVQYYNGQYYDVLRPTIANLQMGLTPNSGYSQMPGMGLSKQLSPPTQQAAQPQAQTKQEFTPDLQAYINKQNTNAYRALNGGLLGYSPQDMTAGNAGGTPTTATGAQMQMPSSMQGLLAGAGGQLAQTGQLDPLQLALQNRSWMKNNG